MEEISKEKRMLLIVDPQIDFITGSLPVPGAPEAMDALARYVKDHGHLYGHIHITCDRHHIQHPSFKEFGGQWPPHCIESSVGAAVWPALMEQIMPYHRLVLFNYKGEDTFRDEYSIFRSEDGSFRINIFLRDDQISHIDICGLAGDVCVKTTLEDALQLYPRIRYRILEEFTASLDGGAYIRSMSESLKLRNKRLDEYEKEKRERTFRS